MGRDPTTAKSNQKVRLWRSTQPTWANAMNLTLIMQIGTKRMVERCQMGWQHLEVELLDCQDM